MESCSRREFLSKFTPKHNNEIEGEKITGKNGEKMTQKILTRRDFIKLLGLLGGAMAFGQIGIKGANAQEAKINNETKKSSHGSPPARADFDGDNLIAERKDPEKEEVPPKAQEEEKNENSYAETALEQTMLIAAKNITNVILRKFNIDCGNMALSEEDLLRRLREKPIKLWLEGGIVAPAVEEALFRALPSSFISKNDKNHRWDVGIPASLLFALVHNIGRDEYKRLEIVKSIPLSQFMGGLFYWYLIREKGYSHSLLAHSMNNSYSFAMLLLKAYPG